MQIYYQQIKELPDYIAWIQCDRENIDEIRKMFPKEEYEILVAIKPNYDPLTCSTRVLYNPCLLYTSPSPRDRQKSRMPSSA